MLEFIKISHPSQIKSILSSYDPLKDTWIVSDLKSKQEIQNDAINKHGYFSDDAILRVSDFWRIWLRRLEPTLHVVSGDFIKLLVQNFVDEFGSQLEIFESEVSTLNKAIQEFAPLLLHPASDDVLQDWIAEEFDKNQKEKKWHHWYKISKICMNYIVYKRNALDARWSAAFLQSLDLKLINWPRRLFIDLGSELSSVEMSIFKVLAQKQNVIVVVPEPDFKIKFPFLLNVYRENFGYGSVRCIESEESIQITSPPQFVRLSTQLAEVKFAVSEARKWVDQGFKPDDIAIIAADIEKFWPILHHYLEEEGLPYRKDVVTQMNSLGDVQNLLAAIKNYSLDVAWDSLEKTFFTKESHIQFHFEKFKGLFYQLYDIDDLGRDQKIKELFYKKIDFSQAVSRDEFLSFLVKIWIGLPESKNKANLFENIVKDVLGQSLNINLKLSNWISFLKSRLTHKEVSIKRSSNSGLHVLSLMSAHMNTAQQRIYIGLNDEFFIKKQNTLMNITDANIIKNQFDLSVDCSEESFLDFNLRWQALMSVNQTYYTSAHLGFNADPLNASLFFIENSPQSEVQTPSMTRLDELQQSLLNQTEFENALVTYSKSRLIQDLQGFSEKLISINFNKLSVSDLENYGKCSFKLLASKGFKLRDYSQVSIDLDPRDKGNLAHALFEHLIMKLNLSEYKDEDTVNFLNEERDRRKLYVNLEDIWAIQRNKFLQLARRFAEFEKDRIKIFSSEAEKKIEIYFDLDKAQFTNQEPDNGFSFNMRLDRIDTHRKENYCVIYDYKSSAFAIENSKKWLSHYQFQMLLYVTALKLTLPEDLTVKGSLYYLYKNFDLKKGIIDKSIGINEFLFNSRNASLTDDNAWQELDTGFIKLVSELLSRLKAGEFKTEPFNFEICNECDWRKLCRATHLM